MQAQKETMISDPKYGTAEQIMALPAAKLAEIVADGAADAYAKAKACQRLAVIGGAAAVPALARLLGDERLSHYARTALEQIPDRPAGDALIAALAVAKGRLLIGVINSIGVRRDTRAIRALTALRMGADPEAARAASAALARIRPEL
jgi:hypothetical protein